MVLYKWLSMALFSVTREGRVGDRGRPGLVGPPGSSGATGTSGVKGDMGFPGAPGSIGFTGLYARFQYFPDKVVITVTLQLVTML